MTRREVLMTASGALRRVGWLALLALPVILAACGQNGTSTY